MMIRMALCVTLLCGCMSFSHAQSSSLPVPAFSAEYKVYGRGFELGVGTIRLIDEGGGHYRMQSRLKPEGLASLLVSDRISEDTSGRFHQGIPHPAAYTQRHSSDDEERVVELRFDWNTQQVAAVYLDGKKENSALLPLSARLVDPLSLHLLVMTDLLKGQQSDGYAMINKTEIKQYAANHHGEEVLETPVGDLKTLRISQRREGSSRETVFWFAADFNYIPAQIAQYKDGKEQLRMVLQAVQH